VISSTRFSLTSRRGLSFNGIFQKEQQEVEVFFVKQCRFTIEAAAFAPVSQISAEKRRYNN
jgi:hypothetical protein